MSSLRRSTRKKRNNLPTEAERVMYFPERVRKEEDYEEMMAYPPSEDLFSLNKVLPMSEKTSAKKFT